MTQLRLTQVWPDDNTERAASEYIPGPEDKAA